jgi:biofilm PGA synthesis N-glycosyltransferase PgaC
MLEWIQFVERSQFYLAAVVFFGLYPMLTSLVWVVTGLIYYVRRDRHQAADAEPMNFPMVSVLVPAYCEEDSIGRTLAGLVRLDYPHFEVIVISDGSTDRTVDRVLPFLSDPRIRLLDKRFNEGKAMALNDAIPCARGELLLILDSDAVPDPMILRHMVPHFQSARVGAVAGTPRVANRRTIIARLQAVEFSSIVGLLRRAQRVWGRVMCISGVVGMFRKSAVIDAGMFTPGMATEDIDLTWKLQLKLYDVRYEARALVWMLVPDRIGVWWKQRRRWALGLGQILRRHSVVLREWRLRRMLPIYIESSLSVLWALCFLAVTAFWCICWLAGHPPRGGSPVPNLWGMLLFTMALLQLACGVCMDRRYEPEITRDFFVSIIYPTFYWALLAATSCLYTIRGLARRPNLAKPTLWRIEHRHELP